MTGFGRRLDDLEAHVPASLGRCAECVRIAPFSVVYIDDAKPPFIRPCPACGAGPVIRIEVHRKAEPSVFDGSQLWQR